jgi:uncharacterized protein
MLYFKFWLVVLFMGLTTPAFAQAPARHALIIANTAYDTRFGALANPDDDARLIAGALGRSGFAPGNIKVVENLDQRGMKREIQQFASRMRASGPGATGFFYFAGHGLQRPRGGNYLLPVREELSSADDLDLYAINLDVDVVDTLRDAAGTLFIVIDACRDAPSAFRSAATRGLQRPTDTQNVLIAFSTSPGSVAADGANGTNSPFARALANALPRPGIDAVTLFRDVRREVAAETGNRQIPFSTDGLLTDFVFVVANVTPKPLHVTPPPLNLAQMDALYWQGALAANTKAAFEDYLARYPTGQFASLARANVGRLTMSESRTEHRQRFGPEKWGLTDTDFGNLDNKRLLAKSRLKASAVDVLVGAQQDEDPYAMVLHALSQLALGVPDEAAAWFRKAANAGNTYGMWQYGLLWANGNGVLQNEVEAVRWYRAAAQAGNTRGMTYYGGMLEGGRGGLVENDQEAVRWFQSAALAGDPFGMVNLGSMLETGRGAIKNEAEALRWYRAAAATGDQAGQVYLADLLIRTPGPFSNNDEAVRWAKAALSGENEELQARAQAVVNRLGIMGIR